MGGKVKGIDDSQATAPGDTSSKLWQRVRGKYAAPIRVIVDAMVADGGMSLVDVLALHLADYSQLGMKLKAIAHRPNTYSVQAELESARVQHLKGMRAAIIALNPSNSPNDRRHPVPEDKLAQTLDRLNAIVPDPGDTGEDLVN